MTVSVPEGAVWGLGLWEALVCSCCSFLRCEYCHGGWFQAPRVIAGRGGGRCAQCRSPAAHPRLLSVPGLSGPAGGDVSMMAAKAGCRLGIWVSWLSVSPSNHPSSRLGEYSQVHALHSRGALLSVMSHSASVSQTLTCGALDLTLKDRFLLEVCGLGEGRSAVGVTPPPLCTLLPAVRGGVRDYSGTSR